MAFPPHPAVFFGASDTHYFKYLAELGPLEFDAPLNNQFECGTPVLVIRDPTAVE